MQREAQLSIKILYISCQKPRLRIKTEMNQVMGTLLFGLSNRLICIGEIEKHSAKMTFYVYELKHE